MEEVADRKIVRYSMAFKRSVVEEVESGSLSSEGARRRYAIGGAATVSKWVRQFGKIQSIPKVVIVQTPEERDQLKVLKEENMKLRSALADAHLKIVAYESLVEVADEHYKTNLKKNYGPRLSSEHRSEL